MKDSQPKDRYIQTFGGLRSWLKQSAGSNEEALKRVQKHLPVAIQEELTPQQQRILQMYFYEGKNTREIGEELGLHPSTVSRTRTRAEQNLYRVLRYCF